MKKSIFALMMIGVAGVASAQVNFVSTYSQNFDALVNAGTANAWTDNTTITGWYMRRMDDVNGELADQYNAGDGTSNAGAVYSFGAAGSTERALGSVGSGSVEHSVYGVRLKNTSGAAINSITVAYTGEEWRDGGNTTPVSQALAFSYSLNSTTVGADLQTGPGAAGYSADTNFTRVNSLDFNGPVFGATATALDGNLAANQVAITGTITFATPWANGADLWIRWVDVNDAGNDLGLGIDNLTVTANTVPEPASMAALGLGALALIRRRRNSK